MRDLNSSIRSDHIGNAAGDKKQGLVIVAAPHQRDCFALKTADLPIRQRRRSGYIERRNDDRVLPHARIG